MHVVISPKLSWNFMFTNGFHAIHENLLAKFCECVGIAAAPGNSETIDLSLIPKCNGHFRNNIDHC